MERGGTPTPRPFPLRSAFRCARPHPLLNNSFGTFFARRRRRRFFVLKDSCLAYYMHPSDDTPLDAVLFDGFTSVHLDNDKSSTSSFTLLSSSRTLTLKCSCHSEAAIWVDQIQKITTLAPIQSGPYTFGSATPMRGNTCIAPLVCAHDYFLAVGKALEKATTEIFIAGWWLSPDIQLNRTNPKQTSKTLRQILTDVIEKKNVTVYVLLYKEPAIGMPNKSQYAEEQLKVSERSERALMKRRAYSKWIPRNGYRRLHPQLN